MVNMWYEMMWVYSLYKTGGCLLNCSLDLGSCTESRRLQKKHDVWCLKQIPLVSAAVSYCICWFLWCQWLLNLIAASLLPSVVVSHHKLCCDTHAMIFIWHQSIHPILVQFVSYALSVTLRPKCCGRRPVAQSQQNYVEAPGKSLAVTLTETHPFCQTIRPNARNPCEFYVQRPVLNRTSYLVCK